MPIGRYISGRRAAIMAAGIAAGMAAGMAAGLAAGKVSGKADDLVTIRMAPLPPWANLQAKLGQTRRPNGIARAERSG